MKKARFEELLSSVKQATEIARGARAPSRTFEVNAATIKELRSRTKLSQPEFAALVGVELSTLRSPAMLWYSEAHADAPTPERLD